MPDAGIGLPEVVAAIIGIALTAYAVTGGADFGGGVWDLLASGPRRERQRALIASALAPIWEANHVWLIVVIVMLFTAFPPVFQSVSIVLHIPLAAMLVGIVLRGAAFVFRSYGHWGSTGQRRWGRTFAISSIITPLLLGVVIGAIASGDVGRAATRLHEGGASFTEVFVMPWLAPFPLAVGVLALVLFAFLAAVYLGLAAHDADLREDFRVRAIGAGAAVFLAAGAALVAARESAPLVHGGLLASPWALPLQAAVAIAAVTAFAAIWTRRWRLARFAAAAQLSLILAGWAAAQYPLLLPPALSIRDAASPRATLVLLLWGLGGGTLVLAPSLWYLFRTFAAAQREVPASD